MTSLMEMSLADIIKNTKRKYVGGKPQQNVKKNDPVKPVPIKKVPIADARNKIIMKKRIQITDAREKLSQLARQKDARLKLEQLRKNKNVVKNKGRKYFSSRDKLQRTTNKEMKFTDSSRQVVTKPMSKSRITAQRQISTKKYLTQQTEFNIYDRRPIVRTIENEFAMEDDPMDGEYTTRPSMPLRKANLHFKIVAQNNDISDTRRATVVQRSTRETSRLAYQQEKESSPARPPSILKKRPMAALKNDKKPDVLETSILEYRIIVSNLRSTVTGGDIEELFGDIGGMVESRLVRPGTAEVIYKTLEDAQRAVELYHNRQLDGQPMTCLLVTPRPNAAPSRSSNTPALYSTNSNVEPDLSTFHKVLFSNM